MCALEPFIIIFAFNSGTSLICDVMTMGVEEYIPNLKKVS